MLLEQMENGNWVDAEARRDEYIQMAVDCALKYGKTIDADTVRAQLAAGEEVRIIPDFWYAFIRETQPAPEVEEIKTVVCDCGHTVRRESVMDASTGTACPDCYDEMSY